jgi:hypothetical protein
MSSDADAAAWLLTPEAVRERAGQILAAAERGELRHFALDAGRMDFAADYVIETMRGDYPDLRIPFHSRWRHFTAGSLDRWARLATTLPDDGDERARIRFDLAVTSVLLDAGAGGRWRFREPESGRIFARSEGLAVASFRAFERGLFSADPARRLRVDAAALKALSDDRLAAAFQVSDDNPLVGVAGRAELLRRLGRALETESDLFGPEPARLGGMFDYLKAQSLANGTLPARAILTALLRGLESIWPGRVRLAGRNLGDTWRHPAARARDASDGLVPFHKLSQWLAYSLIEPLQEAGIAVTDLDDLTGLAEYRNGGLFLDSGVLRPRRGDALVRVYRPDSELVVEWRALTIALLDRIAERVRARLGLDRTALPLAKVLEGGTWSAGRRIAAEMRVGGSPPIAIDSDGAIF